MTNSAIAKHIFISRAGADAPFAGEIGRILEDAGYRVTLQQWDFANRNFMECMHTALESGARVMALLSPEYFRSDACLAEALNTIGHDPLNRRERLIVMRVAECTPGGLFTALAYWDLLPIRTNAAVLRDVVLNAVRTGRRKDASGAASPYWREARAVLHGDIRAVPNFTGRRVDLAALDAALWANGGTAAHAVAITQAAVQGLGGVGKSVLAVQYAWENRERYAGVWRFTAETASDVTGGLITLGAQFIPGLAEVQDRAEAARTALQFIEGAGFEKPWLLIYDNVETPAVLGGLTPRSGAQMLITTRWPDWAGRAAPVALGVFTLEEAVEFLGRRTGRTDAPGAARLAETLGRLPLALDHAAAFCVETGDSFDDYRQRLGDWIRQAPEAADYPKPVFATFSLAIGQAAAKCPEAETLMGIFAWLAPDDIPRDIVTGDVMDAMTLRKAVGALSKVSLLEVRSGGTSGPLVSLHRLVQMVMRGRLAGAGAETALRLVADAFPGDTAPGDVGFWSTCERLYPHAMTVLESAPESGEAARYAGLLLNQTGQYLFARAEYAAAEPHMRRALDIDERCYGADHPNMAVRVNNLARLLQTTNRLAEAEPLMRRALCIGEKCYGSDHPRVATCLNNLAMLCRDMNRMDEAESLMQRALEIDKKIYGPEHPNVAIHLNNLATLYRDMDRLAEAQLLLHFVLDIDLKYYGVDHPNVATGLNNLAELLKAQNQLAQAEPYLRHALDINERNYGPEHPSVATGLNNLGRLLHDMNRLDEAEPLIERALDIDEKTYGPEHPRVAIGLNNLAQLFQDTNRMTEAEPLMRRALAIFEASLPDHHPSVYTVRANLADLLDAMGGA